MPRQRTNPDVLEQVSQDRINRFGVFARYDGNGNIDPAATTFEYTVTNYTESGKEHNSHTRSFPVGNLPQAVKAELKAIYNRVLAFAEQQGEIGAGTDSGDDF